MGEASASISLRHSSPPAGALRLLGDDRLARLAAQGNEHAVGAIFARHHQGLYRYCRSIIGHDEDARDALQNTMVKALRALPGETREIALKPWLYRIAHNEAITVLRQRAGDTPIDEVTAATDHREADAETRERLRMLVADLGELPDRQRSALVMRELNGLTYKEIAAALDSSPAAAKQSVYEAREALHELAGGREMDCKDARRPISAGDQRILRGRRLRAHLRACGECRTFASAIRTRRSELAALTPPLPPAAAAAMLNSVLGGGGGGSAGGGGLIAALGSGGANSAAGSAAVKLGAVALTVGVGVGAYEAVQRSGQAGSGATAGAGPSALVDGIPRSERGHYRAGGEPGRGEEGRVGAGRGAGSESDPEDGPGTGAGGGSSWQGASGSPGSSTSPPGNSTLDASPHERGAAATPPGHDGEPPPGQGGAVPGVGGDAAPPFAGTPPGKGGTVPGLEGGTTPGQGVPPAGPSETSPGMANKPGE